MPNSEKDIIYRFFNLPISSQRKIIFDLGVATHDDLKHKTHGDFYRAALKCVGERGLVEEFIKALKVEEGNA